MIFYDNRGYLQTIDLKGIYPEFVWEFVTKSSYGVLRGLHYQVEPKAQGKLIAVLVGRIFDASVDLQSGEWQGGYLEAGQQIYIPTGYAHGFQVVSDSALVLYKCTSEYSPEHERGIIWDDNGLGIDWPIKQPILSERDKRWSAWKKQ